MSKIWCLTRRILGILAFSGVVFSFSTFVTFADHEPGHVSNEISPIGSTILPETKESIGSCKELMNTVAVYSSETKEIFKNNKDEDGWYIAEILACGIKTGSIRLWMIPYYIRYILEFIVGIAGLIAVGGIVYGGYLYLFAGVSDAKDQGKKAIMYGVLGLIMTLVAWAVVNIVIAVVTG